MIISAAQTGGVDNVQRHTVDVDMFAQHVAGGAGDIGDDGGFAAGQGVQQARFAGIGTPGDHHGHAIAQQRALASLAQYRGKLCAHRIQLRQHMAIGEEVDFLFREVDGGLDIHAQADQLIGQAVHAAGELSLQ